MLPWEPWYRFMLWAAWLINEEVKKMVREWLSIHFKHSFHESLSWFLSFFYLTKPSVVPLSRVCNTWNYLLPPSPPCCLAHHLEHSMKTDLMSCSTVYVQHQEQCLGYFTSWKLLLKECISFILSDKHLLQDNLTKKNHEISSLDLLKKNEWTLILIDENLLQWLDWRENTWMTRYQALKW